MLNKASLQSKRVLCVFAHPDDETFGPGGTLIKWSKEGATIHLLCATKGEAGMKSHNSKRDKELLESAKLLGIKKVEFLGYIDGTLCNNMLQKLEEKIAEKIRSFKPDILLTFNFNGVSGHIDHIMVSSAVSHQFEKSDIPNKLYYYTALKAWSDLMKNYFIFVPSGLNRKDMDEIVDISDVWELKVKAMHKHESQIEDINKILAKEKLLPKADHFIVVTK